MHIILSLTFIENETAMLKYVLFQEIWYVSTYDFVLDTISPHPSVRQTTTNVYSARWRDNTRCDLSIPFVGIRWIGAIGNRFASGTFEKLLDLGFDVGAVAFPHSACGVAVASVK
jgi:hypothetical protein